MNIKILVANLAKGQQAIGDLLIVKDSAHVWTESEKPKLISLNDSETASLMSALSISTISELQDEIEKPNEDKSHKYKTTVLPSGNPESITAVLASNIEGKI